MEHSDHKLLCEFIPKRKGKLAQANFPLIAWGGANSGKKLCHKNVP